jgi:tetratricopeptide (TPR) repeat protein
LLPWRYQAWLERAEWLASPMARALDAEGADLESAAASARRAVQLSPRRAVTHKLLGDILAAQGRREEALDAYRRARDLHPTLPAAWFTTARQAERAGLPPEVACRDYRQALDLLPEQYHERNRVVAPRAEWLEFVEFFSEEARRPLFQRDRSEELRRLLTAAAAVARTAPRDSGAPQIPSGVTAREAARRLSEGVTGAESAVERWNSLPGDEIAEVLWESLAPRLWLWSLQARLRYCVDNSGTREPRESQR